MNARGMRIFFLVLGMTISGAYATWKFSEAPPQEVLTNVGIGLNERYL